MEHKLKLVGLLRFSVLTPTYYSERFDSLEEIAAHLFSPERMELRFRLFERLSLPSLLRQSDADFDMVILTAETLPEVYLQRLADLLEPHDHLHLLPVGTGNHYQLLKQGYDLVPTEGFSHRALFRLDDDDALDGEFIARTRRLSTSLLAMQTDAAPFVIAYNRGFYLDLTEPDAPQVIDTCERAPLSAGTTLVAPVGSPMNPYRYNHRKFAQYFNTYSDISAPGFIRTIHGDNKSDPAKLGLTHRASEKRLDKALTQHFGMTLSELKAI